MTKRIPMLSAGVKRIALSTVATPLPQGTGQGSYGQGRGGRPWRRLREWVLARDHHQCQTCKASGHLVIATEVDHVIPLSEGGVTTEANLKAICPDCHKAKTAQEAIRAQRRVREGDTSPNEGKPSGTHRGSDTWDGSIA